MLLELRDVHVHYHKVAALKGIDMGVPDDGIVTIIGANGAGKSTTLRAVSGLVRVSQGDRDKAFKSPCTGTTAPLHHTPWIEALDDSMKAFLATKQAAAE